MTPLDLARLLMEKAAHDEAAAARFAGDAIVVDEIIGFHCQQAAEKILKAVLSGVSVTYPWTHDLAVLIDLLATNGYPLPAPLDDVRLFTPYAVDYRYATPPATSGPLDRPAAIRLVSELRVWAETKLAALAPPPP
jgi:HEPN domain-containing protein